MTIPNGKADRLSTHRRIESEMRPIPIMRLIFTAALCSGAWGHQLPTHRFAFVEGHGPLARASPIFAIAESMITDSLTAKLTSKPGYTLVDRASVEKIIQEQNFQNGDRSSADTAAKIGKLLGVGQIGVVNVNDLGFTEHPETSGRVIRSMGTTVLRANVRVIDVETGTIVTEPSSAFQDSVLMSETTQAVQFGAIRIPPKQKLSGDPEVIKKNEWAKGSEAVVNELIAKLTAGMASAPGPKMAPPLVAGISNGSVFINQGTAAGIAKGSKFQVTREVNLDLLDPATGKPMMRKQRICVLTIMDAEETNASGSCQGGLPQSKDVAEPFQP